MVLVDVGAHDLRHCDEVVGQELAIVVANSAYLRQALIAVEEILFPQVFKLLRFLCHHEAECFLFILDQLVSSSYHLILWTLKAPLCNVLSLEQLIFLGK